MNTQRILTYLRDIRQHNNREWFHAHKDEYDEVRRDFNQFVADAIVALSTIDPEVAHLEVKDCVYRFNRDTRFSPDKSPYKTHLGAYICAKGKKALRGGYYLHVESDNCLIAVGSYWLPTNILTACRNEIMGNIDEWLAAVENKQFTKLFGRAGSGEWEKSDKGFGLENLKTCPAGFPRDYKHLQYLRMKDYCCWHRVDEDFFAKPNAMKQILSICQTAKPMMDFINNVIDDYE